MTSSTSTLTPARRKALKASAHALDPVVLVGDAGLTDAVLAEIDRSLSAHELIKVRVAGDDREARLAMRDRIVAALSAEAVQHIGKLLVLYRPKPFDDDAGFRPAPSKGRKAEREPRRTPTQAHAPRSTRKPAAGTSPPRTERIRKSGQRSAKKPHQSR